LIEAAIVDASVGIKWVVNETESEFARLLSACDLLAPDLFPIECSNILWKKVRIRDLTRRDALDYLDLLRQSPVAIVPTHDLTAKAWNSPWTCSTRSTIASILPWLFGAERRLLLPTSGS
jgi:predicted nucleic acid-binding protein